MVAAPRSPQFDDTADDASLPASPRGGGPRSRHARRQVSLVDCASAVDSFLKGDAESDDVQSLFDPQQAMLDTALPETPATRSVPSPGLPAASRRGSIPVTSNRGRQPSLAESDDRPVCPRFIAGNCRLGVYCKLSHTLRRRSTRGSQAHTAASSRRNTSARGGVEDGRESVEAGEDTSDPLVLHRYFWLEKTKGYHDIARWHLMEEAAEQLESIVDPDTMHTAKWHHVPSRAVQKLKVVRVPCWALVKPASDAYEPFTTSEGAAIEHCYVQKHQSSLVATHGCEAWVLNFATMEAKSPTTRAIAMLVRQPVTLHVVSPPANLYTGPQHGILGHTLSLCDASGVQHILYDHVGGVVDRRLETESCVVDCEQWAFQNPAPCPHVGCTRTDAHHLAAYTHECLQGSRCYFYMLINGLGDAGCVGPGGVPNAPLGKCWVWERARLHCLQCTHSGPSVVAPGGGAAAAVRFRGRWGGVSEALTVERVTAGSEEYREVEAGATRPDAAPQLNRREGRSRRFRQPQRAAAGVEEPEPARPGWAPQKPSLPASDHAKAVRVGSLFRAQQQPAPEKAPPEPDEKPQVRSLRSSLKRGSKAAVPAEPLAVVRPADNRARIPSSLSPFPDGEEDRRSGIEGIVQAEVDLPSGKDLDAYSPTEIVLMRRASEASQASAAGATPLKPPGAPRTALPGTAVTEEGTSSSDSAKRTSCGSYDTRSTEASAAARAAVRKRPAGAADAPPRRSPSRVSFSLGPGESVSDAYDYDAYDDPAPDAAALALDLSLSFLDAPDWDGATQSDEGEAVAPSVLLEYKRYRVGRGQMRSVERVCNRPLWAQYLFNRASMGARAGEGVYYLPVARDAIALILRNGLASGRRVVEPALGSGPFGNGHHFYTTCQAAKYASRQQLGGRDAIYMFMCLVCTGRAVKNCDPRRVTPPLCPTALPVRGGAKADALAYDSTCSHEDPAEAQVFVVYEGLPVYPMYLLCLDAGLTDGEASDVQSSHPSAASGEVEDDDAWSATNSDEPPVWGRPLKCEDSP